VDRSRVSRRIYRTTGFRQGPIVFVDDEVVFVRRHGNIDWIDIVESEIGRQARTRQCPVTLQRSCRIWEGWERSVGCLHREVLRERTRSYVYSYWRITVNGPNLKGLVSCSGKVFPKVAIHKARCPGHG